MRAALRLPDGEVRLPLGALLQALGLLGRGPAEVVGRLLGVDQGGPDRTFQVLELLQPVAKTRHLLAHPLVFRVVALELVGHGVEEIVDLVRVVTTEAALELFAPYINGSYGHLLSPRNMSYRVIGLMKLSMMIKSKVLAMESPRIAMIGERSMPKPPSCSIGTRLLMGQRMGLVTALTAS